MIIGNTYTRRDVIQDDSQRQMRSLPDGPIEDIEMMKEAFVYLKLFTIVKHDITQDKLISLLYSLADCPYPQSCKLFVLTFSGYGGKGFVYSEDEKHVKISDIVAAFASPNCNKHLAGIP